MLLKLNKTIIKRSEVLLFTLLILIFSLSMYCIYFDETVFGYLEVAKTKSNQPLVGQMEILNRDIRRKGSNSVLWENAKKGDEIRIGDRVFTGKRSSLRVNLEKGGALDLGENTMVTFSNSKGRSVANLTFGKMKVAVNGSVNIAVNGKLQTIKGKESLVEVSLDSKQKPKFRVIKSESKVDISSPGEINNKLIERKIAQMPAKNDAIIVSPKLIPQVTRDHFDYVDRLYDFYEANGENLYLRERRPDQVLLVVNLKWEVKGVISDIKGQLSSNSQFEAPIQSFDGEATGYQLSRVFLGENYWRVVGGALEWSAANKFIVNSHSLPVTSPKLLLSSSNYYLLSDRNQIKVKIVADHQLTGFVVEFSNSAAFNKTDTQVRYKSTRDFDFTVSQPQEVFLRVKGVNAATELTEYSAVTRIRVLEAPRPTIPRLAEKKFKVFTDEDINLIWAKSDHAKKYEISLRDLKNKIIETKIVSQTQNLFKFAKPGEYRVQLSSVDRFERRSEAVTAQITVESRVPPQVVTKQEPEPTPPERKVSSTSSLSTNQKPEPILNMNHKYANSSIELEGGGHTAISSQEFSTASTPELPEGAAIGVKLMHWLKRSGIGAFFGTKVASLNNASTKVSPVQLEARYQYRWSIPWNLFSNLKSTQLSLIGGYEYYRNGVTGPFSPGYDTVKTGFGILFPMSKLWESGGEVIYGRGLDSSNQFEVSGHASYFLRSDWSLGVGYRVRLFEAGSTASAPSDGLPFREGTGEAFSILKMRY